MKIGDNAIAWRERFVENDEIKGKAVVIVGIDFYGEGWFNLTTGKPLIEGEINKYIVTYEGKTYKVLPKALAKLPTAMEMSSWDKCVWQPEWIK